MNLENINLKKIIIILSALLVVVLTAFAAYNIFLRNKDNVGQLAENNTNEPGSTETEPYYPSENVKAISQEPVLGVMTDGKIVRYYAAENGHVFESKLNGSDGSSSS